MNQNKILDKYHRVYVTINLDAIYNNIKNLKARIRKDCGVVAVIKADGYGHGAVPIAKVLFDEVSAFAVATVDEALVLRNHNMDKPIYVIGYTYESGYEEAIAEDIRLTVFRYEDAKQINDYAIRMGKVAKIHIKIDTGMSRIGYLPNDESIQEIQNISKLSNIEIEGLFTHLANADESDKSKAVRQFNMFMEFAQKLDALGIRIPVKHCSNSAAVIELPDMNLDCVRVGIAMYGLYPSEEVNKELVKLTPALEMKSHVVHVKELEAGVPIGYGGTYITTKQTKVATIPVGYGDGYRRSLSNKGEVLLKGKRYPIIGRVCMDQFMVDVTDSEDVKVGDEVTLLGRDGDEIITAECMAAAAGDTFNYEIICDIGKRIPRVYYYKGNLVCAKDYFDDHYEIDL